MKTPYELRVEAKELRERAQALSTDLPAFAGTSRFGERQGQINRLLQIAQSLDEKAFELDNPGRKRR